MPMVGPGTCPVSRGTCSPWAITLAFLGGSLSCVLWLPPHVCCMLSVLMEGQWALQGREQGPSPTKSELCTTLRRVLVCVNIIV